MFEIILWSNTSEVLYGSTDQCGELSQYEFTDVHIGENIVTMTV